MTMLPADEELLEKYRKLKNPALGDQLLSDLFGRYHRPVALWCLRFTGDREQAGDLAQEVFLKAYRSLNRFEGKSKFSTWLFTITRNHCFNYLKSRRRSPVVASEDTLHEVTDESSIVVFDSIHNESHLRRFRYALNETLTDTERKAMILRYVEELPMATVTQVLGLDNPSGAKAYLVSAKRKLRRVLARLEAQQGHGWA